MAKWLRFAKEHAKVVIFVAEERFRIQYGDGKWQAIVIVGKDPDMGPVIVSEICYGRQRPYARTRLIGKRKKLFSLDSFCQIESLLPILGKEIQKIVKEKTERWENKTFCKKLPQTYVRKKGVTFKENYIELNRGIIFSLSLLDKELDFFLKGATDLKQKIKGFSAKVGLLLEYKQFEELKIFFEQPHNQVFLLPTLLKYLVAYGNPKMNREELIYFLQNEKMISPSEIEDSIDFWLSLNRSPRSISLLTKEVERIRKLLGLRFRICSWNKVKNYITIEVCPNFGKEVENAEGK
jgi:hypothetical protein